MADDDVFEAALRDGRVRNEGGRLTVLRPAGASAEMPRYVSHKTVHALEIDSADPMLCKLTFRDKGYAPIKTDADMWSRYKPVAGDYYVVYADGYKSFSPRKAFLEGYTRA